MALTILGLAAAGYVPAEAIGRGTTLRFMTGAPAPPGADAVIPFEDTDDLQQRAYGIRSVDLTSIGVEKAARLGDNVRCAGSESVF